MSTWVQRADDDDSTCKICGSKRLTVFAHTARCHDCGVLLFWPYPIADMVGTETAAERGSTRAAYLEWYRTSAAQNHTNFTNMLRFAMDESIVQTSLDILDYGGGGGQFALIAKSNYPEGTIYYTDKCEDALLEQWKGVNNQIPFDAFAEDEHTFDVIFLNDVFEHVADPVGVLSQCAKKLKPAGRIFIDTPKQFWLYPATRLVSPGLYRKLLAGTVSAAHLQIWSRRAFALAVERADLSVVKYSEVSEYTMPAHFYLKSMGITNPALVAMGGLFYKFARYLASNKIICVLKRA